MKKATRAIRAGQNKKRNAGIVNTPVFRASTVLFDTVAEMRDAYARYRRREKVLSYGRRGTPTHWTLQEALTDLADGPEDWLADSALAGLVELGNLDTKRRTSVVDFARGHLTESARRRTTLDLPQFANECDLIATIPWCPAELVRAARTLRARDRDDLTDH